MARNRKKKRNRFIIQDFIRLWILKLTPKLLFYEVVIIVSDPVLVPTMRVRAIITGDGTDGPVTPDLRLGIWFLFFAVASPRICSDRGAVFATDHGNHMVAERLARTKGRYAFDGSNRLEHGAT